METLERRIHHQGQGPRRRRRDRRAGGDSQRHQRRADAVRRRASTKFRRRRERIRAALARGNGRSGHDRARSIITLDINGRDHAISVEPRRTLADAIREDCGQTGTHIGCEHGICGACTVIVDGEPVRSCLMFAVQAEGKPIRTVEGLADGDTLHPLQQAFMEHHGLQCGFCTPGFLMLDGRRAGARAGHQRRRPARRAVVEPLPLHRLPEHHQGGPRAAAEMRAMTRDTPILRLSEAPCLTPRQKFIGRSVPPPGGPAAADRPGPLCRRRQLSRPVAHARGALAASRMARHPVASIRRRCAAAARRACGVDRRGCRGHSADRLPPDRIEGLEPIASACWPRTGCAMSASRSPWCSPTIPISPRMPPTWSSSISRSCRRSRCAPMRARRVRAGPLDRAGDHPQGLWRRRRGVPQRACGRRARALRSAAIPACRWRRAAPSARYDAARDMLEMHGAAKVPHWNRDQIARMLGRSPSPMHLYEGHVGGGFGIRGELYPEDVLVCAAALRLRRPVKWIEDRREHLIAANHSRQQQHRIRAAIDADGRILGDRRRVLPRPGRLCAHARGDRARSRRRHAARALSRAGLSRRSATSG